MGTDLRTHQLTTRLTHQEADQVTAAAKAEGRTISQHLRFLAIQDTQARQSRERQRKPRLARAEARPVGATRT